MFIIFYRLLKKWNCKFISMDGFETTNLSLVDTENSELTEEDKHKNLFEKNLDYILEEICEQDELELVDDHIDELVEDACYINRRYNNDILTFFLECFYNDFKLYKGRQRKDICSNIYYFFYSNYESIYYNLNYGRKYRVLTKKDFQSFRFKNGYGQKPKKLLQFLVDFFKVQVYLVDCCAWCCHSIFVGRFGFKGSSDIVFHAMAGADALEG